MAVEGATSVLPFDPFRAGPSGAVHEAQTGADLKVLYAQLGRALDPDALLSPGAALG